MKKGIVWIMLMLLLTGCSSETTYETIGNVWEESEPTAVQGTMDFALPEGARMEVLEENGSKYYSVGNWEIWTQVYPSGNIRSTIELVTGLEPDMPTVVRQQVEDMTCHETAWSTTGEDGMKAARTAVLDDGNYHYCISVMVPESDAEEVGDFFTQILDSVSISGTEQ